MSQENLEQARNRADELVEADYMPRPERECDIVMKGGITSGIVYPLAVCELAKSYRFRKIGGASAGAIAATMTAAAERGREAGGFGALAGLPAELGHTLTSLFRPQPETRSLHDVLLAAVTPGRTPRGKVFTVVKAMIRARPAFFALGVFITYLPALSGLLVFGGVPTRLVEFGELVMALVLILPLLLPIALLTTLTGLAITGFRALENNFYGLCIGSAGASGTETSEPEHLTDWLAHTLDRLAGLPPTAGPLTFRHLWGPADQRIDLEVMTTNVTLGRPARFPFSKAASNLGLYKFCEKELDQFFPPHVFKHMIAKSEIDGDAMCPDHGVPLRELPPPEEMPVVVATRLSLSFPGLISAVPLFTIDRSSAAQLPVRCWFSDGGITSNFPIHFFDTLFPERPTFGINLRPYHLEHPETDVYRPGPGATGRVPPVKGTATLLGFLKAILDTMQNWTDDGQSALPGFRDRIADVHLHDDEGGMNLAMPSEKITLVAERGRQAGEAFASFDWPQHRWTRYLTAMSELQQAATALRGVLDEALPDGSPGYDRFVREYGPKAPPSGRRHFYWHDPKWCQAAASETRHLVDALAGDGSHDFLGGRPGPPRPDPDLRVTPHF